MYTGTKQKHILLSLSFMLIGLNFSLSALAHDVIGQLDFKRLLAFNNNYSDEVTRLMQDKNGFLWIATRAGLYRYDGYRIHTYRDNLLHSELLTSNQIKCLAEDNNQNIWIGTENGLNVLDCKTGKIQPFDDPVLATRTIWDLAVTQDSAVWVALDFGIYQIKPDGSKPILYDQSLMQRQITAVKTILQDSKGRIWAGTWDRGLFRYDPGKDAFINYPAFNTRNSVHVLFEDSRQRLWAGTWNEGLYLLDVDDDTLQLQSKNYRNADGNEKSIADNIIYCIAEEPATGTIWIGTRNGLSIFNPDREQDGFINYQPDSETNRLPYNELDDIVCDPSGLMWLGTMGGGVYSVNINRLPIESHNYEAVKPRLLSPSVRSMLIDSDDNLWMGIGTYGLVIHPKNQSNSVYYTEYPGFKNSENALHTINCIRENISRKEIWFGTWGNGIYIFDKQQKHQELQNLNAGNSFWLPDDFVFSLFEDQTGNFWIGCRSGLAVLKPDLTGINLSDLQSATGQNLHQYYNVICQTTDHKIWLGTDQGLFRLQGDFNDLSDLSGLTLDVYNRENQKLANNRIQCIYQDKNNELWLGTDGAGLQKYNPELDCFESVSKNFNLQADVIVSIREDETGDLWLGTNNGLIHLLFDESRQSGQTHIYTTGDGLLNNAYLINASASDSSGKMYFGGHSGYNSFYPSQISDRFLSPSVVITDLLIFNTPFNQLMAKVRNQITDKAPGYTDKLVLRHDQNHFGIEFSALSFTNPAANLYAYRLDGYDSDWQYTDASNRMANYSNLNPGSYLFHLKGSSGNGAWNDMDKVLRIKILPAPWETGWAYLLYFIALSSLMLALYYRFKKRIQQKRTAELQAIEQAKMQEMNHIKLQFFTNITHELLTPLTILSASVDELKMQAPQLQHYYTVMGTNINRLIRLMQQILEFRKSESGNLQLKVSKGDLVAFIRKEMEAIRPLMKKKQQQFAFHCEEEELWGFFDPDKLDKILYNLLSNASKYNREGGSVDVILAYDDSKDKVTITVKDNGDGIGKEKQQNLFMRFYEGDYRRFKTTGTGIGLSLTKDLVELHNGEICLISDEGEGATFIVTIPIVREAYQPEQIDEHVQIITASDPVETGIDEDFIESGERELHTILLVEDNEELLSLMTKLLNRDYQVLTAANGKEAIRQIESKDVSIDLIVSDIMMPEMDGITLCKYIKEHFEICHIPVLLLTAKNQEEDRIEAYETGADGFISKPFNLSLLHARIRNLLKKKERAASDFKKQLVFEMQDMDFTSMDEDFLQRAIECVRRNIDRPEFDQQLFIEEMNTSKSTLYKKLKSLTGLNTSAFIRNIRLKTACKIIEEKKQIRISELAYAVGFNDPKYFSLCFKKEFGLLPTDYIEKYLSETSEKLITEN